MNFTLITRIARLELPHRRKDTHIHFRVSCVSELFSAKCGEVGVFRRVATLNLWLLD
jgi:hypothetical protein